MKLYEYTDKDGNTEIRNQYGDVISKEVIDEFLAGCNRIQDQSKVLHNMSLEFNQLLDAELEKANANK
jgi:hypothetical protein